MPKQTFYNLPDEKRENILAVSINEFANHGYSNASVSHIVEECAIAKGSFYQYFDDKDDLYEYIMIQYIAERKHKAFRDNEALLKSMTLTEFLRYVFKLQVRDFINNPKLMKIAIDFNNNAAEHMRKRVLGRYEGAAQSYFVPYIREEKSQGEIDENVDETLLNCMLLGLGNYVSKWISDSNSEYNSLTEAQIDMIVDKLDYILTNGIYMKYINPGEV